MRLAFFLCIALPLAAQPLDESALANIDFEQKLRSQISLDLVFRNENGEPVRLAQYFGRKPVILTLGYYECPMLCSMVLNGMVESLQDLKWSMGKDFEVVTVSIDPRETSTLAAAKKRTYLKRYGRAGAGEGWHFLVGDEFSIRQLASEVGFQYAYDAPSRQFAHPSGLVIATPQGKVAAYVLGVSFKPPDLSQALQSASINQVRSPVQKLILLCFHYNPFTGRHSNTVMAVVRALSAITALTLGGVIWMSSRRSRAAVGAGPHDNGEAPLTPRDKPAMTQ